MSFISFYTLNLLYGVIKFKKHESAHLRDNNASKIHNFCSGVRKNSKHANKVVPNWNFCELMFKKYVRFQTCIIFLFYIQTTKESSIIKVSCEVSNLQSWLWLWKDGTFVFLQVLSKIHKYLAVTLWMQNMRLFYLWMVLGMHIPVSSC